MKMTCLSTQLNTTPSVEPIDLVPNNTMTTNAGNTHSLKHTFEPFLQRMTQMKNSITYLQTT